MTPAQRIAILGLLASLPIAAPLALGSSAASAVIPEFRLTSDMIRQIAANGRAARRIDVGSRVHNWGTGSCVHASIVHLLHWQGLYQEAERWRATHSGGATPDSAFADLDKAGIPYAGTTKGDVKFLEWAMRTRRGANVTVMQGRHMVTLVGMDKTTAHILDSNDPGRVAKWSRDKFLQEWRSGHGGWAFTLMYPPPPPKPWRLQEGTI